MKKNIMNKFSIKLSTLLTAAVLFASCSNDDDMAPATDGQVDITTRLSAENQATAEGAYKPAEGTTLDLYYASMGNTDTKCQGQFTYTGGEWQNTTKLFWDDLTKDAAGNYPFFAASPQTPDESPAVEADQSGTDAGANADNYTLSDQLIAYTSVTKRKSTLNLNFRHVLAQLKVVIESPAGDTQVNLSSTTLTVGGAKTAYTLKYTGSATGKDDSSLSVPCEEVPAIATAKDDAEAVTVTPKTLSRSAGSTSEAAQADFVAILPPQQCAPKLTFTIEGKNYTYDGSSTTLTAGKTTAYKLTVTKSGVTLQNITLQDWDDSAEATEAGIKVVLTGTASEAGEGKEDIKGDAMSIWKKTDAGAEADKVAAHAYKKGTDGSWTSTSPIYVDDTDLDNDRFYATIANDKDAKTSVDDLIGAGPARMGQGQLNFGFRHLMAQLAINVKAAADFPAGITLTGATVKTPDMLTAYTLGYDTDNSNALKAIATDNGNKTAYDGLSTGVVTNVSTASAADGTITGETAYLVVPQDFAAGASFTVTLTNGKTYTGKLASAMTLQPGKKNVLTLTLNATDMTVGSITLAEWGPGASGDGNVQGDGIKVEDEALKGIDQAGNLYIAATADGAAAVADNGSGTYPVKYEGNTASIDKDKTAGYAPIIWDNLAKFKSDNSGDLQQYTYAALFVPTGYRHGATADDSHEKDYLTATTGLTAWGTQPDFSTSKDHQLKHAMAQLTVKLVSDTQGGNNFTTEELKAASVKIASAKTVTATEATATLSINNLTTTKDVNLLPGTGTDATSFSALIAPQTLAKVFITINGNSYTLAKEIALTANQIYSLEVSVQRTPLGFSADVTAWETEEMQKGDVSVDE